MSWRGLLTLDYTKDGERTIAHDRHEGPLRVLQRLYPEGDAICHHVLVHPPGGVAGGDVLEMRATLAEGTHGLITTPGATRFYRSAGAAAEQTMHATVAPRARLEWLPLETIAYPGCIAHNHMRFELAPGAEMIGWDMLALGLPAASQAFDSAQHPQGQFTQSIELPGVWLERGTVKATDTILLDSPLGWAGQRVLGTLWMAAGHDWSTADRDHLLDLARAHVTVSPLAAQAGASSPDAKLVVLRVLAPRVEPLMQLFTAVRGAWRQQRWQLSPDPARIWRT